MDLVQAVNQMNEDRGFPEIYPGDYVRVHINVAEGERSRVQVFHGVVIRNRGNGPSRTFTVRRIASHGIGVERTFLYKSPRIEKIEITRHNKVRRAQLYYMRELRGKSARLKEIREVNRNKPKYSERDQAVLVEVADEEVEEILAVEEEVVLDEAVAEEVVAAEEAPAEDVVEEEAPAEEEASEED
jgi:large subunit ribosomal protein L19